MFPTVVHSESIKIYLVHTDSIDKEVRTVRKSLTATDFSKIVLRTAVLTDKKSLYKLVVRHGVDYLFMFGNDLCEYQNFTARTIHVNVRDTDCGTSTVVRHQSFETLKEYWSSLNFFPDHYILVSNRVLNPLVQSARSLLNAKLYTVSSIIMLRNVLQELNKEDPGVIINGIDSMTGELGTKINTNAINKEIVTWNGKHIDVALNRNLHTAFTYTPNPNVIGELVAAMIKNIINGVTEQEQVTTSNIIWVNQQRLGAIGRLDLLTTDSNFFMIKRKYIDK